MSLGGAISLCSCRVLYLGSAIPLETAVGIESIQQPCRERYDNVDAEQRASGIDSTLSVYSSGVSLQFNGDDGSNVWFPINTLHVCAAVKAVQGAGNLRFVSLDTAAAQDSCSPPLFACIMRRTKGIKVLECHVFVCKSDEAAMALVQSCTHAFQHKEGWMGGEMPSGGGARIVSAGRSGGGGVGPGVFRDDLAQKFDVSCSISSPRVAVPAPTPPDPCVQPVVQMVAMNPPGAPVCQNQVAAANSQYFSDWNQYGGQPLMIIPGSPFYPQGGTDVVTKTKKKHKKTKKNKKRVESSESSDEEETVYVRRSALEGRGRDDRVLVQEYVQQPAPPAPQPEVIVYAPRIAEPRQQPITYQADNREFYVEQVYQSAQPQPQTGRYDDRAYQDAVLDDAYVQGYYDAHQYAPQLQEQYVDDQSAGGFDTAYYPDNAGAAVIYYPTPGFTDLDSQGGWAGEPVYHSRLPAGTMAVPAAAVVPVQRDNFVQVADGLGYYP